MRVQTSYGPQFSSERDQIWTHVFIKCLKVLRKVIFEIFNFGSLLVKNRFLRTIFDKMTYTNKRRVIFIRSSPNFNATSIFKYIDFLFSEFINFEFIPPGFIFFFQVPPHYKPFFTSARVGRRNTILQGVTQSSKEIYTTKHNIQIILNTQLAHSLTKRQKEDNSTTNNSVSTKINTSILIRNETHMNTKIHK